MRAWFLGIALVGCGPFNDTRWCESHPEECTDPVTETTDTATTTAPAGLCGGPAEARAACEVMIEHCYECHGQNGRAEGGFNYLRDVRRMVQTGKVVPFDPTTSRVQSRMDTDTMPPADVAKRPTASEVRRVREWIEDGAPDWNPDNCADRDFVSPTSEMETVVDDLLARPNPTEQRNTRYLSLTHLYNACVSDDELETYRYGLSKLINSLSYGAEPVLPRPVDDEELLFAVDLRDLSWDERNASGVNAWEHMVKRIPYGLSRLGSTNARELTGSRLPVLPADWVVFAAARPPLYDEILKLPTSGAPLSGDQFLRDRFQVDRLDNITTADVLRAGFEGSGVSDNNRMIERHAGVTGTGSYCWVSYDFATDVDVGNILSHPLHPNDPVGTCPEAGSHTFSHAGGEIICSLPNGLQAYYLEEADGAPLSVGPIEIVQDFEGPEAPVVMNGVSCMFCHAQGIIEKSDDVKAHWDANFGDPDFATLFPECVYDALELTYQPTEVISAMQRDRERFLAAMEAVGVPREQVTEPVAVLSDAFSEDMTALRVAAEFGLDHRNDSPETPSRFRQCLDQLEATNPRVALELSPLLSDVTVSREIFQRVAADFVCGCDLIDRDDFQCRPPGTPEDGCGEAGIACLDGQVCITDDPNPSDRIDDRGACVTP